MVQEFHFLKIASSRVNSGEPLGSDDCSVSRILSASTVSLPHNFARSRPMTRPSPEVTRLWNIASGVAAATADNPDSAAALSTGAPAIANLRTLARKHPA